MKVINEKDYDYVGIDGNWYVFVSKPKDDYDPEKIYVTRARFITLKGESIFFDPIKEK